MIGRVNPRLILMNKLIFILLDYFLLFIKFSMKFWIFFYGAQIGTCDSLTHLHTHIQRNVQLPPK